MGFPAVFANSARAASSVTATSTSAALRLFVQRVRVELDVIRHERGDEKVRVVEPRALPNRNFLAHGFRRGFKRVHAELLRKELIIQALVDEDVGVHGGSGGFEERRGVVCGAVDAVCGKRLLTPRALRRIADWRECAGGRPRVRGLERDGEGAVAAHAVPADGFEPWCRGQVAFDERRELSRDVRVHLEVFRPWVRGGVDVEACAFAEVVGVVVGDVVAPRGGVREHHHASELGARLERAALLHRVVVGAGQAGEVVNDGALGEGRGWRDVDGEGHVGARGGGGVGVLAYLAAEGFVGGFELHRLGSCDRSARALLGLIRFLATFRYSDPRGQHPVVRRRWRR